MSKIGVLLLGRKRPGFDPQWGSQMEKLALEHISESEFEFFVPSTKIVDDATLRAGMAECDHEKVDCLVVLQPTMSDGNMVASMAQLWSAPIILWGTPEKQEGSMVSACSLVGTHAFAATLQQLGHPFELVYGMPKTPGVEMQFNRAVRLAVTEKRIRTGKVGLIGYHAPGFIDMHCDPFELKAIMGMQLRHAGLFEFMNWMKNFSDEEVANDVQKVLDMQLPLEGVSQDCLATASRYYLAIKRWMCEESLDALAIRCWPELPNEIGQWPYLAFARLATEEIPVACEGDVDGAISSLIASSMGMGQVYLTDWLEHDANTITIWHGGCAPFGLCQPIGSKNGPRFACHFNNGKPGVINADLLTDMPVTLFRLWRTGGAYYMAMFEGQTIKPRRDLKGTNGLVEINGLNVYGLFEDLCHAGMPHHLAVIQGHHAETLSRFARLMNIENYSY